MSATKPEINPTNHRRTHKYEYSVDLRSHCAGAYITPMVGEGKRVLEIGAGPGSLTRVLREQFRCRVTALEIDSTALDRLTQVCERVYAADLNDPRWSTVLADEEPFEVILAADVLEHLKDPQLALRTMKALLAPGGYLVVSLPNAGHNGFIASLLRQDFRYSEWGLFDSSHVRFFCMKNIQELFEDAGWKITDARFFELIPEETELADHWLALPIRQRWALGANRFGTVYQVIAKAEPAESGRTGISLLSIRRRVRNGWLLRPGLKIRTLLRSVLSESSRSKLRRVANYLGVSILRVAL